MLTVFHVVWVDDVLNEASLEQLFKFCEAPHGNKKLKIERLLIHFPSASLLKDSKDGSGYSVLTKALREFNAEAHKRGIATEFLDGHGWWVLPDKVCYILLLRLLVD